MKKLFRSELEQWEDELKARLGALEDQRLALIEQGHETYYRFHKQELETELETCTSQLQFFQAVAA